MIVNGLEVLSRAVTDAAIRGDKYRIRQVTEAIKGPEISEKVKGYWGWVFNHRRDALSSFSRRGKSMIYALFQKLMWPVIAMFRAVDWVINKVFCWVYD